MRKEFPACMGLLTLAVILGTLCVKAQNTVYSVGAQSTVYVFSFMTTSTSKITLTINGKRTIDLIGPYEKTVEDPNYGSFKVFYGSIRKIIMNSNGPTLFSLKEIWTSLQNPEDIKTSTANTEIDITKGSVYYLKIDPGQIKLISEKEAKKLRKSGMYQALPDYTFDPNTDN